MYFIHFILLFLPATTESASGSSLRMQSNKNSPVSGMMRFTGESCFLFLSFFPCRAFLLFHDSLECGSQTCQSLQIGRNNNLRCFPFARTPSASRLFKVRTASSAPASLMARIPSAFACCTLRIASAWPSASRIRFSFSASARRIAACFSASASRIADCFYLRQPGWSIFLTFCNQDCFTAFTLCFHLFLHGFLNGCRRHDVFQLNTVDFNAPRVGCDIESCLHLRVDNLTGCQCFVQLQISDDVSKCRCGQVFNGHQRIYNTVCEQLRIGNLENTTVSICIVTLSFVMTGCGGKSTTCSFKFTRIATRSINGTLK